MPPVSSAARNHLISAWVAESTRIFLLTKLNKFATANKITSWIQTINVQVL